MQNSPVHSRLLNILLIAAVIALLAVWLVNTPPGLLGKMDAIASAVCHRAPLRSFLLDERPLPLCARCTGMFIGAALGMAYLARQGRRGDLPTLKINIVLGLFFAAFAFDGLNSFSQLLPGAPSLYPSQNWLRLVTGTGMGLAIAAYLMPVFHQSAWADYQEIPSVGNWRTLAVLLGLGALLDLAALSQNILILYPLAVLSGLAVLFLLTCIYTIIWVLVSKQENRYHTLRQMWFPITAGFLTALLQITLMDAGRLLITGTWAGINLIN